MKIVKKFYFIARISALGSGIRGKIILLKETSRIQINFYRHLPSKPFTCKIHVGNRSAQIFFFGTMDEIHALDEIFIKKDYAVSGDESPRTILDLGANIGLASIWYKLKYPEAAIHAYEPNPLVFPILETNLAQFEKVYAFKSAITPVDGPVMFFVSSRSFSSSVYKIDAKEEVRVGGTSLDTAIERIGGEVDMVKMDIEGAEFEVMPATKMLNHVKEIVGEIHPTKAEGNIAAFTEVLGKTHRIPSAPIGKALFRGLPKI